MEKATLSYNGKTLEIPVIEGTEGERAIDISTLRKETGLVTFDPGFQNTASCTSDITFIDGEKGILRYRGYEIEELASHSTFVETAYLLIFGKLPTRDELSAFSALLNEHSLVHEDMLSFVDGITAAGHPMTILSVMVNSLSVFYPDFLIEDGDMSNLTVMAARLISQIRTMAAFSYKKSIGEPFVYPRHDLKYCGNFLNMMFSSPVKEYAHDPEIEKILNLVLILHADHEQNCSTSTVRLVGSSKVNLYASICAGICALWGPLHGGANQAVIEMLESIHKSKLSVSDYVKMVKDKTSNIRLMGFGHRVYKSYDPRAKFLKEACLRLMAKRRNNDPLLEIAMELEEVARNDPYFIERNLYPNVDFYSGIIYKEIGIPTNMFTVMFAMGRMPGWIAQWKEMHDNKPFRIGRPRQIYTGELTRPYVPMQMRQ